VSEVRPSAVEVALAGEHADVQRAVELVGQILTGSVTSRATLEAFVHASLGRSGPEVVCESRRLSTVGHITAGLALAALIDHFDPVIGPGDDDEPPTWSHVRIGNEDVTAPSALSAYFPAGQLVPVPVVVRLSEHFAFSDGPRLQVFSSPEHRNHGRAVLETIVADADGAKNLFRGRALTATDDNGLVLSVIDPPSLTRANVIVPHAVWAEIDLNVAAVSTRRDLMTKLGLGVRRGILLAGPPGVGKTAISQVIAAELLGDFTAITVDARAGQSALAALYKEARSLGPTLVVLEDIDLFVGDRAKSADKRVLSEFLTVMDTDPSSPILTVASTNDVSTLDSAAVRTARFDSIIEIAYPTREAAAQILMGYLDGVPGAEDVDAAAVAAVLDTKTSGADIREIVRRAVLANGAVTTDALVATVRSGRFKPQMPSGNYL
jgi:transitional endoplasmic reticulum ATPase